jgi:hypothetical protein
MGIELGSVGLQPKLPVVPGSGFACVVLRGGGGGYGADDEAGGGVFG